MRSNICVSVILFMIVSAQILNAEENATQTLIPLQIGLFLATVGSTTFDDQEIQRGVRLAVEKYTTTQIPVRLVESEIAPLWQSGLSELVRLVYTEKMEVLIGPAHSRAAHLAEQVVARAKGRFVLLTPMASDTTLTQIKVPWFFSLAHNDDLQTEALLREVDTSCPEVCHIAYVVAQFDHDARMAANALERSAKFYERLKCAKIEVHEKGMNLDPLLASLHSKKLDAVIFFEPPELAGHRVKALRAAGISLPFLGPLWLATPAFFDVAREAADEMILAAPSDVFELNHRHFWDRYQEKYGRFATIPAAYGYDAAELLIEALQSRSQSGTTPLHLAISAIQKEGITGSIAFDANGSRIGPSPVSRIKDGRLYPIHRS